MELLHLALSCLRVGAFVFGGGPVLVPLLREDVVARYAWLTPAQFDDAVGLGQMTPGPLLVTATFIGWKVGGGGWIGLLYAAVATVCIFLPSFFMTIAASHQLRRLKGSPYVQRFLKGVEAGVVGLVAAAAVIIGKDSIVSAWQAAICVVGLVILLRYNPHAGWIVVCAGLLGLAAMAAGLLEPEAARTTVLAAGG